MEQLKVKKKNPIIINIIVYLFLSFVFLYLQYAYRHQLSPFAEAYLRKSGELFWYVIIPLVLSMILIWRHHRLAIHFYNFTVLLVSFKVIEGLFIEFNKIIVIALFFYSVISYFLYQLLVQNFTEASLNPNYSPEDLFDPLLKEIPCEVTLGENSYGGYLTNWDDNGCFIKLASPIPRTDKMSVKIQFQGREFIQQGEVVAETLDLTGFGVKFEKTNKDLRVFNWTEFTELIHELGFKPERLR